MSPEMQAARRRVREALREREIAKLKLMRAARELRDLFSLEETMRVDHPALQRQAG